MLVPEQRQGNWGGFVVLTSINHSPEQNRPTRTFFASLLLSHPKKQMVAVLPCICKNASQITRGLCSGVCVQNSGLLSFQILQVSARIQIALSVEGEKNCYLLLFGKCERGRGTWASAVILPLGCTSENIASTEVFKEITCFSTSFGHKFLWNWLESGF